jgi:opacity protein-like surface antigen
MKPSLKNRRRNGISTERRISGHGEDVDVSFSDILEHLNYGAMGAVGAEKGRWIIAADGIYLNLESDESSQQSIGGTLTRLDADVDIQGFISTAAVGYDLLNSDNTTLHLLGGGRYLWLDFDLDVEAGDGWHLVYHGDIGTGESDLTWQLLGAVNYRFRNVDLVLGYRYLGWNFDAGENDVLDELSIHGPMAGVKFSF